MGAPLAQWDFSAREGEVLHEIPRRLAALSPRLVVMDIADRTQSRTAPVRRLLRGLGVPFDILVYTPEEWDSFRQHPQAFAHRIARTGKVLG